MARKHSTAVSGSSPRSVDDGEQRHQLALDLVEPGGVDAGQLDEHRVGDRELAEVGEAAQHVDVVGVVGGPAVLGGIAAATRRR